LLGAISAYSQEVRPFTDKQIALLQNFAAQAVIAMENARLLTETREALDQQTATAEVLQVINSSPGELAPVFDAVLEKAVSLSEAVYGHLWRFDGEHFHPWRSHGDPQFAGWFEHLGPVRPNPDGDGFLGRVVRGEHVLYIADVRDTEAYRTGYAPVTGLADVGGGRSVLTVALRKDHAVLGVLTVYRREVKQFSEISRDGHKKATNLGGAVLYASPHKGGRSHNGTGQVIGRHTVIAARLPSGLRRKLCVAKLCIVALSSKAAN
jgi:GAF domain-containing protein